jgi:hypothetical protein
MGVPWRSESDHAEPGAERLRHLPVSYREFGATLVAARPRDGEALVMTSTAVVVWHLLDDWTTARDLDRALAQRFPEVGVDDRMTARVDIVRMLHDDDLLERG